MNYFLPIGFVDPTQALLQIKSNPQLWDLFTERREVYGDDNAHLGVSDIVVRYRDRSEFDGDWDKFRGPHDPVWYPAADLLPAVKDIAFEIMHRVRGERLGAVLITRIPAGGQVKPHIDAFWNAETFNTKVMISLESHPQQALHYEEGSYSASPGECVWFRNDVLHWVTNDSPIDRITLIVCTQTDRRSVCHLV